MQINPITLLGFNLNISTSGPRNHKRSPPPFPRFPAGHNLHAFLAYPCVLYYCLAPPKTIYNNWLWRNAVCYCFPIFLRTYPYRNINVRNNSVVSGNDPASKASHKRLQTSYHYITSEKHRIGTQRYIQLNSAPASGREAGSVKLTLRQTTKKHLVLTV